MPPQIPQILDEWEISTINELVKYTSVESETLDLKSEINELQIHISAMANSSGGFLILGIREVKSEDGKVILRYEKIGFKNKAREFIGQQIGNSIFEIDPAPIVKTKYISDGDKFYPVIKIENEISKKAYAIKNKGQFYIRIDSSTRPASRSAILNLFGASLEQIKTIKNLQAITSITKEELEKTINHIRGSNPSITSKASLVDLTFLRNSINLAYWFLIENNLIRNQSQDNFIFVIHTIEWLNAKIQSFNISDNESYKRHILEELALCSSYTLSYDLDVVVKFLSKVSSIIEEYLKKNNL